MTHRTHPSQRTVLITGASSGIGAALARLVAVEGHGLVLVARSEARLRELAASLQAMVERGRGRVLKLASIAAFQPVPGLATYAATKAYVLSLTESLAEELRGSGVSATALCPGITATELLSSAAARNERRGRLPAFLIGQVDAVAAQGWRACLAGDVIVVPGARNRAATLAAGAAPKWLLRRIAGALGRRAM